MASSCSPLARLVAGVIDEDRRHFKLAALLCRDNPSPHDRKLQFQLPADPAELFALDPRLERAPAEKVVRKRYASKG